MRISLKWMAEGDPDKYGKYTDYEVIDVVSKTQMPQGCVHVATYKHTDEELGIEEVPVIAEIKPVLYHAFFKVVPKGQRSQDNSRSQLVEVYGLLEEGLGKVYWVEADSEITIINYQAYLTSCNLIDTPPKSFLQYWLHVRGDHPTLNLVRVPEIEPDIEPEWVNEMKHTTNS